MMKKAIFLSNKHMCQILMVSLLLFFFTVTYSVMYYNSREYRDIATSIARLLLAAFPTFWLFLRIRRYLFKSPRVYADIGVILDYLNLSVRPSCTTLGIWTGSFLCVLNSGWPVIGWFFGALLGSTYLKILKILLLSGPDGTMPLLRGSYLLTLNQARYKILNMIDRNEMLILWAGLPFPERFSSGHFFIVGAVGSGKTIMLRLLMQSTIPRILPGSDWRAIIYDPKRDMMSLLSGMGIQCPVHNLNWFDKRSKPWALAKDFTTYSSALQFANTVIQDEKGENSFFAKAARDLFAGVMHALIISRPGEWTFGELLMILSSNKRTKNLLESVSQTRALAEEHFSRNSKTFACVQYTVSANISMLRPIAALWANSPNESFSLNDWIHEESIVVLGSDERLRAPMDAINRVFFRRATEVILSQSESDDRRIWVFLDEIKTAGALDGLGRLLTLGRSKGVRGVLTSQSIEGLKHTFGDHQGEEIASLCSNKACLRTDSWQTARFCSQVLGEAEVVQYKYSSTTGTNTRSTSISEDFVKKDVVMSSQLLRLPQADRKRFYGYFISPNIGLFSGPIFFPRALCKRGNEPNFIDRPVEDQYFPEDMQQDSHMDSDDIDLMDIPRITQETPIEELQDGPEPDTDSEDDEDESESIRY